LAGDPWSAASRNGKAWGEGVPGPWAWQALLRPEALVKLAAKQLGLRLSGPKGAAAVTVWQMAQAVSRFPEVRCE
jgi:hypothetical protein